MLKKYLCLMLCVLLAFSTLSTAAFAANYTYSVDGLSASAVTFYLSDEAGNLELDDNGDPIIMLDLPTDEDSVTATVTVNNNSGSDKGVVFWIGKYVDDVLKEVVYSGDSGMIGVGDTLLSATINNVKKETGTKTVGKATVTYDRVVLKAYVWASTGKAIAKEATLPNIGTGLKFLKDGVPVAAFNENVTDYSITLERNPAEFPEFRMVSGDNTVTIEQPAEYNLNGKNEVKVIKKGVKDDGTIGDIEKTYNFEIKYKMPNITWTEATSVKDLQYKLLEYVEGDTFSPGDAIMVNRGGSEGGTETKWYATAVGAKLRGLDYIRGRDLTKPSASSAGSVASADIKNFVKNLGNTPMLSFTPDVGGIIYAVTRDDLDSVYVNGTPVGGKWTKLTKAADGHENATFTPDHTSAPEYNSATDTDFKTYMKNHYGTATASQFMNDESLWPNNLEFNGRSCGFYAYANTTAGIDTQYPFGFAYKKTFAAGDTVVIPSPGGSANYIPLYFIAWDVPIQPESDAKILSVSYKADGVAKSISAEAFNKVSTGVCEANVELPATTTLSDFVVTANDPNSDVDDNPGTVTFGASEFEKTVTVATITSADGKTEYTYNVNFTISMWSEHETVAALPYKFVKYVEGDTFSYGDQVMQNRGLWYATAVGANLKGLEYIQGRDLTQAAGSVTAEQLQNKAGELATNGTPMLSFKAKKAGTIYAVANSNHPATITALEAAYVNGNPVGGKWTVPSGHTNGSFTPSVPTDAPNYDSAKDTSFSAYLKNHYSNSTQASDFRRADVWPNTLEVSNKPYGFWVYGVEGSGAITKYSYGNAYKKDFAAGDIVHIPSPGSVSFIPTYFIKWADDTPVTPPPAAGASDATIASVSYKADGVAKSIAAAEFTAGGAANEYVANVELPITTTTLSEFVVAANDSNAGVTDNPGTVTIGASEFAKNVTVATITAEDGVTVYTYKINFTIPMWSEHETVAALPYKFVQYAEGDTFSTGDAMILNRGTWFATAIGENLRGLEYIKGRDLTQAAGSVTAADLQTKAGELATNGTPMLSFKAKKAGTIYAVANSNTDASALEAAYVNGSPVGGAWTTCSGHTNGSFTPNHAGETDYNSTEDTSLQQYLRNRYTNINDFRRVESAWPNNLKLSNKPYGFFVYASEGSGITTKYSFGHAYKKDFEAGDIVHIPSPGSVKYIPTYFIKWNNE